jgi:hypothetical protein
MVQRRTLKILYAFMRILSTTEENGKYVKFAKVPNTKVRRDKVLGNGITRAEQSSPAPHRSGVMLNVIVGRSHRNEIKINRGKSMAE